MAIPLKVAFQDMEPSAAVEADIRRRAQRLERFMDRIIGCDVVVEAPHRHHRSGHVYKVRIDVAMPGEDVHVTRSPGEHHAHEDVHVAIRDAFNAAVRQLEDRARRMRADMKTHEAPLTGTVIRLFPDKAYGFIENDKLGEIYFHANSVAGGAFGNLAPGAEVRLSVAEGESPHGLQASTVTPIGKRHPAR